MYKPCTAAQFKVLEYLRGSFDIGLCLIYPSSPNRLVPEDLHGGKLAFSWQDSEIREDPVPAPSSVDDVWLFLDALFYRCPDMSQWTFKMRHRLWMEGTFYMTYQQTLGLSDEVFQHYLRRPMLTSEDIRGLAVQGILTMVPSCCGFRMDIPGSVLWSAPWRFHWHLYQPVP